MSGKYKDLSGQKFNYLTVIKDNGRGYGGQALWLCMCDCGKETVTYTNYLKSGRVKSCGCFRKISMKKRLTILNREDAITNLEYTKLKIRHNKNCDIPTNINKEFFKKLIFSDCHYCGQSGIKRKIDYLTDEEISINGIDRLDSSRWYFKDNVITCCKHCNYAKKSMSYNEFILHIKTIYENLRTKNII